MPEEGSDSPRRIIDRGQGSTSSHLRVLQSARMRRGLPRGMTSIIQQRRNIHVIQDGLDFTPKSLSHAFYPAIDEKQLTAFDAINMSRSESTTQLAVMSSGHGVPRSSSLSLMRSSSMHTNVLPFDEVAENLVSAQSRTASLEGIEIDRAPSPFCLPRYDSSIFHEKPQKVIITLKETDTFFLFEMFQLTEDLYTPEGLKVKEANERYEYITVGDGSNRKVVSAETQTPRIHTKSRSTYVGRQKRTNRKTFVNNWVMHDTYATTESTTDESIIRVLKKEFLPLHTALAGQATIDPKNDLRKSQQINADETTQLRAFSAERHKFPGGEFHVQNPSTEEQLARLYAKTTFRDAVQVMERIIASNLFIIVQKRFKDLIPKNPCSLDLEFSYRLDLLWTQSCALTQGRAVSSFRWNPVNTNLLAAGYGASSSEVNGVLLVWCIKNPSQPDRIYRFDCPISDIDWSSSRPNLLAIGFYDGMIAVIDVSRKDLTVMKRSSRQTSPSYSPHWQIQWWAEDEQFDYQEQIYTSNQDGRIMRYRTGEDFTSTEIMRISRIEGKIGGVKRINYCNAYNVPISRNPGALLLRRHPDLSTIYFVGTEEGCINRCSTNYLHRHIESFLVHDGPVYSFEFSPFCSKVFLTCGADWCTRIWVDGVVEPLITLSTRMTCVRGSTWCPTNSTIIASIVDNEICIWDIKKKIYRPTSITIVSNSHRLLMLQFTKNGKQLVVSDAEGMIYIYSLEDMPFPPFDQTSVLVKAIEKTLVTKPGLLRKLKKIGSPF